MADPHSGFAVSTDVVVFTIRDGQLQILLVERTQVPFRGLRALPGGLLRPGEDLDTCARRELEDEAGVSGFYLEQLCAFGEVGRDPRGRVISVAYFALVRDVTPNWVSGKERSNAGWYPVNGLGRLAFDHAQILETARHRLVARMEYSAIAFQLLPERFSMRDVHQVYETILGKSLDRRNFHKKMLASGYLVELDGKRKEGAHRPASLYRLRS